MVLTQAQDQVTGQVSVSGGVNAACGQSGRVVGAITTTGSVSLTPAFNIGDSQSCSSIPNATLLLGTLAGDALTASEVTFRSCLSGTTTVTGVQSVSLSLRR